jgi:hypothetical protein
MLQLAKCCCITPLKYAIISSRLITALALELYPSLHTDFSVMLLEWHSSQGVVLTIHPHLAPRLKKE